MRQLSTLLILMFLPLFVWAQQAVTVPKNVYFADIHLTLTDGAQQEIQKKVDALHKHPTYFKAKVELADAYFPLIDQIFKEEGVPADLKFLSMQESGLIGDAVSTSNAVGYWQFKREAASDFNLRVDNVIDERKHILEASRGAAKYFKRSNNYYNNWFNSILSYYLGYSGAKAETKTSDIGAKKMEITEKTHPYLLTFLAHKIAYENFVGKTSKPAIALQPLRATPGQSLAEIALDNKTDFTELEKYNKWLLGSTIPSDKDYYVMLPVRGGERVVLASTDNTTKLPAASTKQNTSAAAAAMVTRNGLNALVARNGDTKDKLALQAGISTRKLLKYNDLRSFDNIVAGTAYYIEPKGTSAASAEYHVVQPGETMQMISQHYGMRLKHLVFKNRMKNNEVPLPGRVLWLQKRRPFTTDVEIRNLSKQTAAKQEMAASEVKPVERTTTATTKAPGSQKENFFTRFVNSFKKNKKRPTPAKQEKVTEKEELAGVQIPTEKKEVEIEAIPQAEPVVEEKPAAPVAREAIYPGSRTTPKPAATTAKPATTPATQETATAKPATTTATPKQEPAKTSATATKSATTTAKAEPVKEAVVTKPEDEVETVTEDATPATKSAKHVVAKGETLYGISKMYNVTVAELTAWNKLPEGPLKLGQELIIAEPLTNVALPEPTDAAEAVEATLPADGMHTVATGETLWSISKRYNVTIDNLKAWNNLPQGVLSIGQQLRVVAPAGGQTTEETIVEEAPAQTITSDVYHTVEAGESLYKISRTYGVTIKEVMEWNKKADFSVKPGEKLLIKKKN
ncbi:LysM peptidoglycan-binding domain-containing protein [Pontibacter pudoricolor]|uniref:LysM peptidoglycan-binding domain-containing protein n=1 Tax=Pontibacter pudoricolor TaxID=2694930 RepID=UPI0013907C10|nr:LysM peptidoglycan-binding domain-containing protein [Pontibacter pudoricolor]